MPSHPPRSIARAIVAAMGACAVTALTALTAGGGAPARAAGVGYGGGASSPGTPATGFQAVVTARTVGRAGGSVTGRVAGGTLRVVIPAGSSSRALTVAITDGRSAVVAQRLPAALRRARIVATAGIAVKTGAQDAATSKAITVVLSDRAISRGDIVVVYDGATGRFTRIAATVVRGRITIRLSSGEALAVLRP